MFRFSVRFVVLVFFLLACVSSPFCLGQDSEARRFWQTYSKAVAEYDFENADRHASIYSILEITKLCNKIGKPELATTLWNRAQKMVNEETKRQYSQSLFRTALTFDNLVLAEKVAKESDEKDRLGNLDTVDLERLSRGQKDALKNYPRVPLEFWKATAQGHAYVRARDFEAADKFIKELDIPHEENDPKTVGAFVYSDIAEYYQEKGDIKKARKWIDKAMAIGGNLYYTGFNIKSKKLALYDEFDKELKKHAKMGSYYGGHMSRELLQTLINELVGVGRLEDAKTTIKLLKKVKDRDNYLIKVAIEEAVIKSPKLDSTLKSIEDENTRAAARIGIATRFWLLGQKELGQKLLDTEMGQIKDWEDSSKASLFQKTGFAIGAMHQRKYFSNLQDAKVSSGQKSYWLHQVLRGYLAAQNFKKKKINEKNKPKEM